MYFHDVVSGLAVTTVSDMWVVEAWIEDGCVKGKIHEIVALQSKVIHSYISVTRRATAPHHSELVKNNWTYESTRTIIDPVVFFNNRFVSFSDLPADCGSVYKAFVNDKPNSNDIAELIQELRPQESGSTATEVETSKPDVSLAFIALAEKYKESFLSAVEKARIIADLVKLKPTDTYSEFIRSCSDCGIPANQVRYHLELDKLAPNNLDMVCISNLAAIARLPRTEQAEWFASAKRMRPRAFIPRVFERLAVLENEKNARKSD